MLKGSQKLGRVKFAKAALRRELCSWRRVMVTGSKYFRLHAMESDPKFAMLQYNIACIQALLSSMHYGND